MTNSRVAIYGAIAANVAIAVTKFVVAGVTGSTWLGGPANFQPGGPSIEQRLFHRFRVDCPPIYPITSYS